ncbi:hypothetical protein G6011_05894 [Alternaria panax]|uniref:Uncharacterized protein n=1 Tax=Alternaria panax TaxID=48097 RepID=A0AAD4I964_9PLEO|nr:hypothetical protein G6011_05894 [Alternaria panax]
MAYPVTTNDKREPLDRRQESTIGEVVYTFLDNIKLRFGEASSEVISILNILGTFRAGGLSKKDTLVAIRLTLGDQVDLKQDLLNVLFHREADWAVGDFDFDSHQPSSQGSPSPQFLQPPHQPQMRLPPISPLWYEENHAYSSACSIAVTGSGTNSGFEIPVSSSLHQTPGRFYRPTVFTSPVLTGSASLDSHMEGSYEAEASTTRKQHDVEIAPQLDRSQHKWEETDHIEEARSYYSQPWSPVACNPMLGHAQSFASSRFDSPALPNKAHLSPIPSPKKERVAVSPSVLGVPVAVPIGQPIDVMPPPSKKRRRESTKPQVQMENEISKYATETASPGSPSMSTVDQPFVAPQRKKKVTDENTTSRQGSGSYIHNLCGKGFSSRSKVKKHHWGSKLNNLETTNGCWAKNDKPNVSWNEHPSCRDGAPRPRPANKAPLAVSKQNTFSQKVPMAPSMVPKSQDRSQTFTGTPCLRQDSQPSLEGLSSYHSRWLPTRSSFENLLTAVNVASQIDAPQPQGRIDSVVSHLDAQAAEAEHNKQYITNWQSASDDHSVEPIPYGQQHPYTGYGLGLQGVHVPVNMALPGLNGMYPYTPSTRSLADAPWNNDHDLVYDGIHQGHATLGSPFSPGLDKEGRQI